MGKSVFVLEDDEGIRDVIILLLEEENYDVKGFASVEDFNLNAKNLQPDLFLLDVMLPDGSGMDVCGVLKKSENTKNIPVLMMSAHAKIAEINKSCNAQGFIAKPFDIYDLLKKVDSQLNLPS
ncbi:PleD family two-component system response regulator [Pedobacter sp. Leaf250]|uniref:response regulator n=1 Tax=Pedobacter sp. Leaf250 TaxID=2876559 RepID=UPI00120A5A0E|nr:response regulator [Pedobacter sp. Leaf250]RZJ77579.1 MAG: response regulator [Flavobacterium sp.]